MILPFHLILILLQQVTEICMLQFLIIFIQASRIFEVVLPGMFEDLNLLEEFRTKASTGVCSNLPS